MKYQQPEHPGISLRRDCIDAYDLTVTKAAEILGVSRQSLTKIVNCRGGITPEMAIRISKVFGGTAENWLKKQLAYDLSEALKNEYKIKVRQVLGEDK